MTSFNWEVTYKNGDSVSQETTAYRMIDRENVKKFSLVDQNGKEHYSINLEKGDSFLYRRRVKRTPSGEETSCHILAKYTPVGKKIAFVFPEDGSLVIKDNFISTHRWFYPVSPQEFESITVT